MKIREIFRAMSSPRVLLLTFIAVATFVAAASAPVKAAGDGGAATVVAPALKTTSTPGWAAAGMAAAVTIPIAIEQWRKRQEAQYLKRTIQRVPAGSPWACAVRGGALGGACGSRVWKHRWD